jgi:hypothetical protein
MKLFEPTAPAVHFENAYDHSMYAALSAMLTRTTIRGITYLCASAHRGMR